MSPKLFADDYEDDGEEALSRLALRGGGERIPLLFSVSLFHRVLFSQPLTAVFLCSVSGGGW